MSQIPPLGQDWERLVWRAAKHPDVTEVEQCHCHDGQVIYYGEEFPPGHEVHGPRYHVTILGDKDEPQGHWLYGDAWFLIVGAQLGAGRKA